MGYDDDSEEEVTKLTSQEKEALRHMFGLFDKNGSGSIGVQEVKVGLISLGFYPSDVWIEETVKSFDEDGNNLIDFEEFVAMYEFLRQDGLNNPHKALEDALR